MEWERRHASANRFSWRLTFGFVPPQRFDCSKCFREYVEVRRRVARPYSRRLGHGQRTAVANNRLAGSKHRQLVKVIGGGYCSEILANLRARPGKSRFSAPKPKCFMTLRISVFLFVFRDCGNNFLVRSQADAIMQRFFDGVLPDPSSSQLTL